MDRKDRQVRLELLLNSLEEENKTSSLDPGDYMNGVLQKISRQREVTNKALPGRTQLPAELELALSMVVFVPLIFAGLGNTGMAVVGIILSGLWAVHRELIGKRGNVNGN